MATHQFAILQETPGFERYDSYEPEGLRMLLVDDADLEDILGEFDHIRCYWHTRCCPGKNLAYCGITLIPPESAGAFLEVFRRHDAGQFQEVIPLFEQAQREGKFILHYGL